MLKTAICICFVCIISFGIAYSDTDFAYLDSYNQDELYALQKEVTARLTLPQIGEDVFSKDGITVQWLGLKKNSFGFMQVALVITNTSNKSKYFSIDTVALNGIIVGPSANNMGSEEIQSGLSYYTLVGNLWLIEPARCKELHIDKVTTVKIIINIFKDGEFVSKVIDSYNIDIPVDIDLNALLR